MHLTSASTATKTKHQQSATGAEIGYAVFAAIMSKMNAHVMNATKKSEHANTNAREIAAESDAIVIAASFIKTYQR